ncbi:MAG TPA: carboxypeptidase-like regulatory domain-containing protein, partial [Terriglobales bacterium]
GRVLTGKVIDSQDSPLPNAVVYLSNTRTKIVKSYIVSQDGVYRFPALSPNVDYEVYAQHNGRKSDTKTVSQFDSRPQVNINLRIDTK